MNLTKKQIREIETYIGNESIIDNDLIKFFNEIEPESNIFTQADQWFMRENGRKFIPGDFDEDGKHIVGDTEKYQKVKKRLIRRSVFDKIDNYTDDLKIAICVKYDFCNKFEQQKIMTDEINMAIAIADGILTYTTNFPLPVSLISAYFIKNNILRELCNCP